MLVCSRQLLWGAGGRGTVLEVEMTPQTGLYIRFMCNASENSPVRVSWGDGSESFHAFTTSDISTNHTYTAYGRYKIVFEGARSIGFRNLDGESQYSYDAAILSYVDYSGLITGSRSASFKRAVNLERFIAPNCGWMGQRDFAYCTKLKEVQIGDNVICYDGTFQYCSALEKFTTINTGICWSYVWQGCTNLRELRLGAVSQFATKDFDSCPNLMDVYISDKTVDQIRQVASSGNITAGYSAKFPWNANSMCRFHGIDGVIRADGVRLE